MGNCFVAGIDGFQIQQRNLQMKDNKEVDPGDAAMFDLGSKNCGDDALLFPPKKAMSL